ncbi:MAG: hypothetical protein UY48_C0022G0007 [Candidatus Gottesmanbacteria bacterium GW2011_GWB1_49_7]|uniref:Uncharacterized protein n=1 Tax=Candidatus Gottesmanbacteria bacterium GW2011_GWB1_49_7 TaxID=1618448 RepID=A0A0G1YY28_9BACT|nr:MAG: hypothetical protein UY48_C0022G0007 [Candidatus Gottesmanbacteria bacterium GW2011_GWB1_49_7]
MALVERLMHWPTEPESRYIPVHHFFAAVGEIVAGALTAAQVKSFLAMTPADEVDFDALIALAPGTAAGQALYLERVHGVFILAYPPTVPGYSTPTDVRVKLGI